MLKTYENVGASGVVVLSVGNGDYEDSLWRDAKVAYVPQNELLDYTLLAQHVRDGFKQHLLIEEFCTQLFKDLEAVLRPVALRVVVSWEEEHGAVRAIKEYNWGMDADTLTVLREEMGQR